MTNGILSIFLIEKKCGKFVDVVMDDIFSGKDKTGKYKWSNLRLNK